MPNVVEFHARTSARIKKRDQIRTQLRFPNSGQLGHFGEEVVVYLARAGFPAGNGLPADTEQVRQGLLAERGIVARTKRFKGVDDLRHAADCNPIGHMVQESSVTPPVIGNPKPRRYATGMVTYERKLYFREHRKAKGLKGPYVAEKMGMERESLLRLERQWRSASAEQQLRYAAILKIHPEDLWHPPGTISAAEARQQELRRRLAEIEEMINKTGT